MGPERGLQKEKQDKEYRTRKRTTGKGPGLLEQEQDYWTRTSIRTKEPVGGRGLLLRPQERTRSKGPGPLN